MSHVDGVDGVPAGWSLVRVDRPLHAEWFIGCDGNPRQSISGYECGGCAIVKKTDPLLTDNYEIIDPELHSDHVPRSNIDWVEYDNTTGWSVCKYFTMTLDQLSRGFGNQPRFRFCCPAHKMPAPAPDFVELENVEVGFCVSALNPLGAQLRTYECGTDCPECFIPVKSKFGKFFVEIPVRD